MPRRAPPARVAAPRRPIADTPAVAPPVPCHAVAEAAAEARRLWVWNPTRKRSRLYGERSTEGLLALNELCNELTRDSAEGPSNVLVAKGVEDRRQRARAADDRQRIGHRRSESEPIRVLQPMAACPIEHRTCLALDGVPPSGRGRRVRPTELHLARDAKPAGHRRRDPTHARVAHCARQQPLAALAEAHVVAALRVKRTELAERVGDESGAVRSGGDNHLVRLDPRPVLQHHARAAARRLYDP